MLALMSSSGSAAAESFFMRSISAAISPPCRYSSTASANAAVKSGGEEIMAESYSERMADEAGVRAPDTAMVMEAPVSTTVARELIAQLLPGVDADRLVRALLA